MYDPEEQYPKLIEDDDYDKIIKDVNCASHEGEEVGLRPRRGSSSYVR